MRSRPGARDRNGALAAVDVHGAELARMIDAEHFGQARARGTTGAGRERRGARLRHGRVADTVRSALKATSRPAAARPTRRRVSTRHGDAPACASRLVAENVVILAPPSIAAMSPVVAIRRPRSGRRRPPAPLYAGVIARTPKPVRNTAASSAARPGLVGARLQQEGAADREGQSQQYTSR
jgi:hypothetical protein